MKGKILSVFILGLLIVAGCGTTVAKPDEQLGEMKAVSERQIVVSEKEDIIDKVAEKEAAEKKKQKQAEAQAKKEARAAKEEEKKAEAEADQNLEVTGKGTITSELNLRKGASVDYPVVTVLPSGIEVDIYQTTDGWSQVSYNGKTGWVSNQYVQDGTKKQEATTASEQTESPKQPENQPEKVVELNVPYINQYSAGAPMGCEAAALLQGLHAKGQATNHNLASFLAEMPVAENGNPNNGFGGTPYEVVKGVYQSIYPQPLASWGQNYGNVANISGSSPDALKKELDNGNPIVVYVTLDFNSPTYQDYDWGTGVFNAHVVTLTGYKDGAYHITDPARGKYWVNASTFENIYNVKQFAVAIR